MATNDFLPFATGAGANVLSQSDYAALAALATGYQSGIAKSQQLNKTWRQASIMAAVLAQFIVDRSGQNATDDGTTATLLANLKASAAALGGSATQSFLSSTAPQFDASQYVATTNFLARMGLQFSPLHTGQATALSTTMDSSYAGSRLYFNNTANQTATLPATSGLPNGFAVHCSKASSSTTGNVTISAAGGGSIIDTGGGLASSVTLNGGEDCVFVWNSTVGTWVCSGTFMFRLNAFSNQQGLSANGFQKLPGSLIVQWGSSTVNTTGSSITLPTAAPNAILAVSGLPSDPSSTTALLVANLTGSKTSFGLRSNVSAGVASTWQALCI